MYQLGPNMVHVFSCIIFYLFSPYLSFYLIFFFLSWIRLSNGIAIQDTWVRVGLCLAVHTVRSRPTNCTNNNSQPFLFTNELAPLTLYKYKKRSLGRHRGALLALKCIANRAERFSTITSPRDLAWRAPLIMTSKWWRVAQSATFDFTGKARKVFFMNEMDYFGTSEDLEWWMTRDQRWKLYNLA